MIHLLRTTSDNPHFRELVTHLDAELRIRDGDEAVFYSQFNKIDTIKYAVVAYDRVEAVGCGALRPFQIGTIEIKRMYVTPDRRGQGIASKVLKGLETWAAELGFRNCILETGRNQPEAIALYTKNDYRSIPNYGQYQSKENSVCFEKMIRAEASLT